MKKTTIEIYQGDLKTWRRWCKTKKMTSANLMNSIMRHVQLKIHYEFYKTLTPRDDFKRPLSGCKIDKKIKTIEK